MAVEARVVRGPGSPDEVKIDWDTPRGESLLTIDENW
jgi:hypothetical protein